MFRASTSSRVFLAGLVIFLVVAGAKSANAIVDLNGNGMSDIWEMLFKAQGLTPNGNADNDGQGDILLQNTATGARSVWLINGTTFSSSVSLGNIAPAWSMKGAGDFNGDGKPDILWQNNSTGARVIWLMNGMTLSSTVNLGVIATQWNIAGVGDFNTDGKADILWQNSATGAWSIWLMNGTAFGSNVSRGTIATAWNIKGTGDFNSDGNTDIIWQNNLTGARVIWLMRGTTLSSTVSLGVISTQWNIAGVGDFNAHGQADILWRNSATGACAVWLMNGTKLSSSVNLPKVPTPWQIAGTGNFSADGISNLEESRACTDPFNAKSALRITKIEFGNGNVTLYWPSVVGKQYQLFVSTNPAQAGWQPLGGAFLGTGRQLVATFAVTSAQKSFRVAASDLDSDGDGLSDWEELQLGLNPYLPSTDGVNNDYQRVIASLQATTNMVTVSASDPFASSSGLDTGAFTVTRAGQLEPVTVHLNAGGTAIPGTDYDPLPVSVTFPFGVNTATVQVTPKAASAINPTSRTVLLNLTPAAGYQVVAPGSATVNISPQPATGQVLQEIWTGVNGSAISTIPLASPPTTSRVLSSLQNPPSAPLGSNYGTRIRGYIVAPTTGNYKFWIASDDQGQLWISSNDQPANLAKRAWVQTYTNSLQWNKETNQQSALLSLTAGEKYYFEIYQKQGPGGENLAVGWLKPGEVGTVPSEIVGVTPGSLAPFTPVVHPPDGSTLYFANMVPQNGVTSTGSGSATLRVSADETYAVLSRSFTNLTGPLIAEHIHGPADPGQSAGILFDIDDATPQADGSYLWTFVQAGTNSPTDLVNAIKAGRTYINEHTAAYPNGEIRGQFGRSTGTGSFTPPPPPPPLPPGPPTAADAARFLTQATFGPTNALIGQVQSIGFNAFLQQQFNAPVSQTLPRVDQAIAALPTDQSPSNNMFQEAWWKNAITAPDQLRQRVAFALSEIFVVSADNDALGGEPDGIAIYSDLLARNAFGNFRQLLEEVTLSPVMGEYLDMVHNDKPNSSNGTVPNENYAREIMQLFTIGLNRFNPDGTLILDSQNQPVPTYNQDVVIGLAHVFTGWYWAQSGTPSWNYAPANYRAPMIPFPSHHDTANPKQLFDNVVLPAGQSQAQDLKDALDLLFNHANTGPFICRQLIQRLVTSNPSPAYIYRVAQVFANNGQGVRGDLKAVVQAILLDYEARSTSFLSAPGYGHQREPIVRLANLCRAFNVTATSGNYNVGNQASNFGQAPLYSPTVFNFFPPDYIQPGPIAQAGLFAPEFQITTDTTVITSANRMRAFVYRQPSDSNPDALVLDLSSLTPLASNPGGLVDSLNNLLMGGEMSTAMRNIVVNAVTQIPAGSSLERAQTAVHLLVTSPEFVIEK